LSGLGTRITETLRRLPARLGLVSTRKDEARGLLSAPDMILLYLNRNGGRYKGSKAGLARAVDYEESYGSRMVSELLNEGWIQETRGAIGYELTRAGKHRMRPFIVPRQLLLLCVPFSSLLLVLSVMSSVFNVNVPESDFWGVSVALFFASMVGWYYQSLVERQILQRK
jgi:hypothetical protein